MMILREDVEMLWDIDVALQNLLLRLLDKNPGLAIG